LQQAHFSAGDSRGRARRASEDRHVAEELAGPRKREDTLAAELVDGRQPHATVEHDEQRLARVALLEDDLVLGKLVLLEHARDAQQLVI
jgi:hypothetical protein